MDAQEIGPAKLGERRMILRASAVPAQSGYEAPERIVRQVLERVRQL